MMHRSPPAAHKRLGKEHKESSDSAVMTHASPQTAHKRIGEKEAEGGAAVMMHASPNPASKRMADRPPSPASTEYDFLRTQGLQDEQISRLITTMREKGVMTTGDLSKLVVETEKQANSNQGEIVSRSNSNFLA
eukprot:g19614.t1